MNPWMSNFQTVKMHKNMEDKILDCVNYIKDIIKQ